MVDSLQYEQGAPHTCVGVAAREGLAQLQAAPQVPQAGGRSIELRGLLAEAII